MVEIEIWKPIPGYEGKYELSTLNNVKSLHYGKERTLKQWTRQGYCHTNLCLNGKQKAFSIHQLMAITFLNHTPCGLELVIDHKNHIKTDNRVENLRIIPQRENANQKHIKSSSKFLGVSWSKATKKWESSIFINKKQTHLGLFNTEIEASESYENALFCHNNNLPISIKKPNWSSKHKGVSWNKSSKKWKGQITINSKRKHLGYFNTEIEAHNAYQNALKNAS